MNELLEKNIEPISNLCKQFHVKKLYAFGSIMRNDFTDESDIDFLYEMDYDSIDFNNLDTLPFDPFLAVFDLKNKFENLLGKRVDLIPNQVFKNKYMKASVEKSKKLIYGTS